MKNRMNRWTKKRLVEVLLETQQDLSYERMITSAFWQAVATENYPSIEPRSTEERRRSWKR